MPMKSKHRLPEINYFLRWLLAMAWTWNRILSWGKVTHFFYSFLQNMGHGLYKISCKFNESVLISVVFDILLVIFYLCFVALYTQPSYFVFKYFCLSKIVHPSTIKGKNSFFITNIHFHKHTCILIKFDQFRFRKLAISTRRISHQEQLSEISYTKPFTNNSFSKNYIFCLQHEHTAKMAIFMTLDPFFLQKHDINFI